MVKVWLALILRPHTLAMMVKPRAHLKVNTKNCILHLILKNFMN